MCVLSHVWLFVTPWTVAHQAPLSMEFSRQEYCSGLPFPFPRDLPDPGIKPTSKTLTTEPPGKPFSVCGERQESGPVEITPLICTPPIWGQRPVVTFCFMFWASSGLSVGSGCNLTAVRGQVFLPGLPQGSPAHHPPWLQFWWLWQPCLLIRPEVPHFSMACPERV